MTILKRIIFAFCCYGMLLNASHAEDGKPFIHQFGELRVYYQDWLVVCEEKGRGVCRLVKMNSANPHDHFFGNSQLTIYPAEQQPRKSAMSEYSNATFISFFKRDAPTLEGEVNIRIDGKSVAVLQPNQTVFDSSANEKMAKAIAAETYWFEGKIATEVLAKMKTGRWMTVSFSKNGSVVTEKFSLRGIDKSLAFIQRMMSSKTQQRNN